VGGRISTKMRATAKRGTNDGNRPQVSDPSPELSELEAAREAKYREIRDAELDYRTGKLSDADYAAIDAQLRAEAVTILDRLEQLDAQAGAPRAPGDSGTSGVEVAGGRRHDPR